MPGLDLYDRVFSDEVEVGAAYDGYLYLASTTEISPGTGESLRLTLKNPADSGKRIRILRIVATSSDGPVWIRLFENPTSGIPQTQRTVLNANREKADEVAQSEVWADAGDTDLSGGDTGIEFGIQAGITIKDDITLLIPPGGTMGLGGGGGFMGGSASMSIWYIEEEHP